MSDNFPAEGRLIHVAHRFQWDAIVDFLDDNNVKLFEIPPGPSVPDSSDVPTYGLMLKEVDD